MMVRRLLQMAFSAGAFMAVNQRALAQSPGNVANEESSYLVWIVFAGALLIVCATGFMNPKRSHLN